MLEFLEIISDQSARSWLGDMTFSSIAKIASSAVNISNPIWLRYWMSDDFVQEGIRI
jgi:hypothetical protein